MNATRKFSAQMNVLASRFLRARPGLGPGLRQSFFNYSVRLSSSSTPDGPTQPLYELRVYTFQPQHLKLATGLFSEKFNLRMRHSKLFGFWTSEIGDGIFQMVHLWEYDSLSHRRKVRTALLHDSEWQTEFVAKLAPAFTSWSNALVMPCPGSEVNVNFEKDASAVYLLDTITKPQAGKFNWTPSNDEHLVGRFMSILGPTNVEYRLWRYSDIDQATASAVERASGNPEEGQTRLMYPTNISPIQ